MRSPGVRFALTALVALSVAALAPHRSLAREPRVIHITARRFEFVPGQITLKKDEPVKLLLTSADVVHGFYLKPLHIDELIRPGKITEVDLMPRTAGTWTLICDHFCGANHGAMNMKIVVEP